MTTPALSSFAEFWPVYLRAHAHPVNRALHVLGAALGIATGGLAVVRGDPRLVPAAFVLGYGCAWLGHFGFEGNRPASFSQPLFSFVADLRMVALAVTGRLGPHLDAAGVATD